MEVDKLTFESTRTKYGQRRRQESVRRITCLLVSCLMLVLAHNRQHRLSAEIYCVTTRYFIRNAGPYVSLHPAPFREGGRIRVCEELALKYAALSRLPFRIVWTSISASGYFHPHPHKSMSRCQARILAGPNPSHRASLSA